MSDMFETEDKLGAVLVQVQDDLRQLRRSVGKMTVSDGGETVDIQALDTAIHRTQRVIRNHAEEYLKIVNKQLLVLPSIEDTQRRTVQVPKWKPPLENIPEIRPQGGEGPSPGEKHKSALTMRLICNPAHPNNRATMHQKFGIPLPGVHKRSTHPATHQRVITGPVMGLHSIVPREHQSLALPEEDEGTGNAGMLDKKLSSSVPQASLLHTVIQHKAASLHHREDAHASRTAGCKSQCQKQLKFIEELGSTGEETSREHTPPRCTKTPPPSKSTEYRGMRQDSSGLPLEKPQSLLLVPGNISKFPFSIIEGRTNTMATDFCHFKQSFSLCWSNVVDVLEALEKLLGDFAVPLAKVRGERLAQLGFSWEMSWTKSPPVTDLLSVLDNRDEVQDLVFRPGQRYRGSGGIEAAAVHIQSSWRRHRAWTAYKRHRRRKWAAETIATSWLMHMQIRRVRKSLRERRLRQLENYHSRAQHLAANWKRIQSSKRTIIHIPSLGYSLSQRLSLRNFDFMQNIQINRLCDIRDVNVEVIYVSSQHLREDILDYYSSLLQLHGDAPAHSRRFVIVTPEAVDHFPNHNMCLSTLLKYSPRTLKRIRDLIQGKQAYIVGGLANVDDLAVADELGVPVLGPEPAVAQLYSTKSGGRRIFTGAEVDVPPGRGDIYTLNQLHEALAELMTQSVDVQRWLFKMDSEHGGGGTAFCDVCHLSCHSWALQECRRHGPKTWNTSWVQQPVRLRYLDEIPEWLTQYAQPAKTSCYPNWACFLKTFLRQGGVVEAYPPSDSVTCLTVDLLLEPGGEVTMLSCGDQLHGSCQLESIGSSVPQTSVRSDTLATICTRVGQACLQHSIVGYVSVDLATFLDHRTTEQKVWAVDLDLTYSDQLAMTQMVLIMTGGTLNCHTGHLEVPVPIAEKSLACQTTAKVLICLLILAVLMCKNLLACRFSQNNIGDSHSD
ncbi:IQ motif-containing protein H isoform X1 [Genypterus blacodes]|uniref:IQ motif-containing protein H isoform X1 n=1 Tax=Genypterus blacodes TaxID=154954 RepID=UPI003F776755